MRGLRPGGGRFVPPSKVYTRRVPSSSLQSLLTRAGASLERGLGAAAAQLLAPALRTSLTRDEELTVRSMLETSHDCGLSGHAMPH